MKKISTGLNRRRVIGGLVAAPVIAGMAPRRAWAATSFDTIVIGGGMAGLSAALTLEAAGQRVLIVEADERLGGRCYTLYTDEGKFDCGATTIGPLYGRVRALAVQSGTELAPPPGRDPFSYHINGEFVPRHEWANARSNRLFGAERDIRPEALEFKLVQDHNFIEDIFNWRTEENLARDMPIDAYLRSKGVSKEALRLIAVASNTVSLSRTSALFQMREFGRLALPQTGSADREVYAAAADGQYHYVKGGASVLINNLANLLQEEPRLGDPVIGVDVGEDGVDVETRSGLRLRSRAAICTAPYSALDKIRISPKLSDDKRKAVAKSDYTYTTHVFCVPTDPYWEEDGASAGLYTDAGLDRVFANRGPDGEVAWLDIWLNGKTARRMDRLSERELMQRAVDRLGELRPSTRGRVRAVAAYSWGKNEFVQGNKQVMRPGQLRDIFPFMAEPFMRRLRFAGEHTRDYEAGLEAAAETGMREAFAVLNDL